MSYANLHNDGPVSVVTLNRPERLNAIGAGLLSVASRVLDVELTLQWPIALGSLAAAGVSGAVAGWYPARRAASIDVVTALRAE